MMHFNETNAPQPRKPRLALMGEFSAGKSTLSNLLLGGNPLPTRVTATRLPPVWISYGDGPAVQIGHDGVETLFDLEDLDDVDLDETRLIRLFFEADTLQICDLIDMPGISDPNMSSEVWQSVFSQADSVVWCTHATQAWRQSEAATWEAIHEQTNGDNLLLITQFDKLTNERDRNRVLGRVRRETDGMFREVYPVSLLQALKAGEDADIWAASGAARFTEHLVEMLMSPSALVGADELLPQPRATESADAIDEEIEIEQVSAEPDDIEESEPSAPESEAAPNGPKIIPKRVRARSDGERPTRLPRESVAMALNAEV